MFSETWPLESVGATNSGAIAVIKYKRALRKSVRE